MPTLRRVVLSCALLLTATTSLSCRMVEAVPVEPALVVTAPVGPGLRNAKSHAYSDWTVHRGDVLQLKRKDASFSWTGLLDGVISTREGPTLVVGRIPLDNEFWVFASDVRDGIPVAQTSFLCGRMGHPAWFGATCDQALIRRVTPAGDTIAFVSCEERSCPLILAGPRGVTVTRVEGLAGVQIARFPTWDLALVTSQWTREEGHTGNDLIVMLANAGLRRLAVIPIVEADTRQPNQIRWQVASWSLTDTGIRVTGERAVVDRDSGQRVSTTPVDDTWFVTPEAEVRHHATAGY